MKKSILLPIAASLIVGASALYAKQAKEAGELNATVVTAPPAHSIFNLYAQSYPLTKKEIAYFKSVGLIKKHQLIAKDAKQVRENLPRAPKEVINGLKATMQAVISLEKKEDKKAEEALEKATKEFDAALKTDPKLKLVPVGLEVNVVNHAITLDEAKRVKREADKLLRKDRPQEAIMLLSTLINQVSYTTEYVPMELYPAATKKALEALKKGKKEEAIAALATGFNSIVETKITIPTSLLVAQAAIDSARKFGKGKEKEAEALLELARNQVELAKLEGYMTRHDTEYKTLMSEIKKLERRVKGKGIIEKDYNTLKAKFKSLLAKMHSGDKNR